MSGSLLEIKKTIGGVENTRKITKAMQLVAASKMRSFQKKAVSTREYVAELLKVLERNVTEESENNFSEVRKEGKTLFVLYTSDKGLCGPLNNKLINGLVRSKQWNDLEESERMLITIGKKAETFAKNNKITIEKSFIGIPEKLGALEAIKVVDAIIALWNEEKVKEVIFIAPHYKNSFTFYPVIKTFLPFTEESVRKNMRIGEMEDEDAELTIEKKQSNEFMIYEPSTSKVLARLYEQMLQSMFIQAFMELKASEYSSRMIAMQNATDAANKMIGELKLTYNKARQQAITQEIAELIGASMALED